MGVVIPTRNGGDRLRRCLEALGAQRPRPAGLVVVDSGSVDGSPQAAAAAGAEVVAIDPDAFDHGLTRNRGAALLPDVDVVVFLVQDAIPRGDDFLATLAAPFDDPVVGAVSARQVPPADIPPLCRATVERSPMASEQPRRLGPWSRAELEALSADDWKARLLLDDVASAVRAELFRRVGFREAAFGEDVLLAWDLLWGGWALEHEPRAVVEHGHAYDVGTVAPRFEQDADFFRSVFGVRVRAGWPATLKGWCAQLRADRRWLASHPGERPAGGWLAIGRHRWRQVTAQARGSRGPLGALPDVRPVPRPGELAA